MGGMAGVGGAAGAGGTGNSAESERAVALTKKAAAMEGLMKNEGILKLWTGSDGYGASGGRNTRTSPGSPGTTT